MSELPQRVQVVAPHVTSDPNPMSFHIGDTLGVGHRDRQWTDFVWCTDQAGRSGWVPRAYIEMTGAHEGTALRDYDARELTVATKEILDVLDEAGGWFLCRTSTGQVGWVPGTALEPA